MPTDKVRLSVDCSPEERRQIKIFCAMEDHTVSEWIMGCVRERMLRMRGHLPNAETRQALRGSEKGEGVQFYQSTDELFDDLGI